jgi:hypothetical protein
MNPIKRNMEEGTFSLLRSIYRHNSHSKTKHHNEPTLNITYPDSSSRIQRLKSIATGKEIKTATSYSSYDPNTVTHTIRRLRHAGAAAPKKKGLNV